MRAHAGLGRDLGSLKIPDWWIKDIQVIFTFNTEYQKNYHFWASALGGNPAMCLVKITTDQRKIYTKESGCNVWIHNPKKRVVAMASNKAKLAEKLLAALPTSDVGGVIATR